MATSARRSIGKQTTLRHVWLASLGATALGRARAIDAAAGMSATADEVAAQAMTAVRDAGFVLRGAALTVRERLSPVRAGIEAKLASGVFAALSVLELPSLVAASCRRPPARRRRAPTPS